MSTWQGGFTNEVATILPGSVGSTELADGAITSIKLASNLQSDNYDGGVISVDPGTTGWRIERNTGNAVFNDGYFRGTIFATSGELGTLDVSGILTLDSTADIQTSNFSSDPNHGIGWRIRGNGGAEFYGGVDVVSLYSYGTVTTGYRFIAEDALDNGTPNAPAYGFYGSGASTNMGMFKIDAGAIGFSVDGKLGWSFRANTPSTGDTRFTIHTPGNRAYYWEMDDSDFDGLKFYVVNSSGVASEVFRFADTAQIKATNGSVTAPTYSFGSGTNYGMWKVGNALAFAAGGNDVFRIDSGRTWYIPTDYPDVGNVEVLRADRTGSTTGLNPLGYFSSYAKNKRSITPLSKSPKWNRKWFMQLEPVTFIRRSTKGREFGFVIDQFKGIDDNLKYLTTKGNEWGQSLDEFGLLAVTVDYVQHLERRVAALERAA